MSSVVVTFSILILGLMLSWPIGAAIGIASAVGFYMSDIPIILFSQKLLGSFNSFPLLAIPFFLLAGDIMQHGSIANSLLKMCNRLTGHLTGGMGQITIVTSLFYGALCGSGTACVAAVGSTMIPAMEKDGYPKDFSVATNSACGVLGLMIPPSTGLIVAGSISGVSVADLFVGTIIPGCLLALMWMGLMYYYAAYRGYGQKHPKRSWAERMQSVWEAKWAIGVPVIILGMIYTGIATPTEAGGAAVIYALLVEALVYKAMTWSLLKKICFSTARVCGMLMFIVMPAMALGTLMQMFKVEETILAVMTSVASSQEAFFLVLLVMYVILGTFMESLPIMLIFTPVIVPVCQQYGINLVHFLVWMNLTISIGMLTPPVGGALFVGSSVGKLGILPLSRAIVPFVLVMVLCSILVAFFPSLSLCLL